jgi:large subunit ribosomal protein L15
MQFHNLKRNKTNRKAKQVGRGGTRGKTSGRGTKGQNARAGHKKRPEMRDIIKRLPKLRGRGKNFLKSRFVDVLPVKLSVVAEKFKVGETVNPKTLLEKGIVKTKNGRIPKIKILADKEIKKSFVFEDVSMSAKVKKLNE